MLISKLNQACFRRTLRQTPEWVLSNDNRLEVKPSCLLHRKTEPCEPLPTFPGCISSPSPTLMSSFVLQAVKNYDLLPSYTATAPAVCAKLSRKVTVREVKPWAPSLL